MSANNNLVRTDILSLALPDRSCLWWLSMAISVILPVTIIHQLNSLGSTRLRGIAGSLVTLIMAAPAWSLLAPLQHAIGLRNRIGVLITLITTCILLVHLLIGGMLAIADLFDTSDVR